jgi:hypothetical protein
MPCAFPNHCSCVAELPDLHERLDRSWTEDEVDDVYASIVIVLACMTHNNPDPEIREQARVELLHAVYDEARERWGENLDQPDRRAQ